MVYLKLLGSGGCAQLSCYVSISLGSSCSGHVSTESFIFSALMSSSSLTWLCGLFIVVGESAERLFRPHMCSVCIKRIRPIQHLRVIKGGHQAGRHSVNEPLIPLLITWLGSGSRMQTSCEPVFIPTWWHCCSVISSSVVQPPFPQVLLHVHDSKFADEDIFLKKAEKMWI